MLESCRVVIQYACVGMLAVIALTTAGILFGKSLRELSVKVRRGGMSHVALVFLTIAVFVAYGGSKGSGGGSGDSGSGGSSESGGSGGTGESGGSTGESGGSSGESGSGGSGESGGSSGESGSGGTGDSGGGSGGSGDSSGSSGESGGDGDVVYPSEYRLYENVVGSMPASEASVYNGYLYNDAGIRGTLQVKVAKPKNGESKITMTILTAEEGKETVKGLLKDVDVGEVRVYGAKGRVLRLKFGAYGLVGEYGTYRIDGARNRFVSKMRTEADAANAAISPWIGPVNVSWDGGVLTVAVAKKGKAKVSGSLADGTKVTVQTQLLIGESLFCVPVFWTKGSASAMFTLWLSPDGASAVACGLDGASVGMPKTLAANARFSISRDDPLWSKLSGTVLTEYLQDVAVKQIGAKWQVDKAGKISYKGGGIDDSKAGDNPSGLKLSYKAKDGSFKGSFKVYSLSNGKLKATTVNVVGVLVGNAAQGFATVKKTGSAVCHVE